MHCAPAGITRQIKKSAKGIFAIARFYSHRNRSMMNRMNSRDVSPRALIQSAAFVPLAALTLPAQQGALTPAQMKTLVAFIDRLIPRDELGPGAVDAGAQIYIDRVLAGPEANEKESFLQGVVGLYCRAKRR